MVTDKERITSYLDPALYKKLEKFKKAHGFKTLSKAVTTVLEDYFAMMEKQSIEVKKQTANKLKREIEEMKIKLNELSKKVDSLDESESGEKNDNQK